MTSFGPFTLSDGSLTRDGKPIALGQRAFALLEALAVTEGPVDKATLIEAAWPGTIVEDGNLTVQIAALRKALGTRPDGSEWIVTVPRVGYRLIRGEASSASDDKSARRPTIAVLPFQNLGGNPADDSLADSIVEDIITALSRFRTLAVAARNSSFVYKNRTVDVRDAARELGVRYVLEGSIRHSDKRLRVTAQLIDGETGAHLWARNFDSDTSDLLEVQDRITQTVAGIVYPKIENAELEHALRKPPEVLSPYELVLQAQQLFRTAVEADSAKGMQLFLRAVDIAPDYGTALIYAANALWYRLIVDWPRITADDRGLCLELTERALKCADGDPNILVRVGMILANGYAQYERGLGLVAVALEDNSNSVAVLVCAGVTHLRSGDLDLSIDLSKRAVFLMPTERDRHWSLTALALAYMARGDFNEALAWSERSIAATPAYDQTYWMLIAASAQLGRLIDARHWLEVFRAMRPTVTISSIQAAQPMRYPERHAAMFEGLRLAGLPE